MKRFASFLIAAAMVLSMAACGNKAETNTNTNQEQTGSTSVTAAPPPETSTATDTPAQTEEAETEAPPVVEEPTAGLPALTPDDPTTFTVFIPTSKAAPSNKNKIADILKSELGVTLEMDIIASNFEEKIGVMIASSDYPDIIGNSSQNARFIEAGALIPMNDYLKPGVADNILEHVLPVWNRVSYTGDGLIYILPNYNRFYGEINGGTYYGPAFFIQKAVLAEFDYPTVTSLDDYFGLIERYMEKYPTIDGQKTIGFEICAAVGKEFCLLNAPEHLAGYPNDGGVIVNNGVAEIFANKDIAKTYYQYLNTMNAKGIIDQETFTQNYDQYIAKLASGRVLGMFDQRWNFGNAHDALVAEGREERTWVGTMPVYDGVTPYYRDRDVMNINQGYGISTTCKDPDKAVAFLNTILDEKWQKILNWGIEGEDYYVNEEGRFLRTPEQREEQKDAVWKSENKYEAFFDMAPKHQGTYSDGNSFGAAEQPEEFFVSLRPYDQDFLNAYGKQTWMEFMNQPPENPPYYPAWSIPLVDGSEAQMVSTEVQDASVQYLPRAILAAPEDFESIWADYTAAIDKINYKVYEEFLTQEIQWRIENWGN